MKAALPLFALVALAACVPSSRAPAPVPAAPAARPAPIRPAPLAVPQAPVSDNWMDVPATPGAWRYASLPEGSVAEFVSPSGNRLAAISCSYGREVFLAVHQAGQGSITIRTETATRTQMANLSGIFARTLLAPNDPLLDAMALSKGRFALEPTDAPPLYLPSHAEISRVIEDCRG